MAIDSHMHINSIFTPENNELLIDEINNNSLVEKVINVGVNVKTSEESINISRYNEKFYSSIGIHPLYTSGENVDNLYDLAIDDKVVAIGEIGLDDSKDNFHEQRMFLIEQIAIANDLELPVIIHSNNSNLQVIEIFERYVKPKYGCVFHCFQPDLEVLDYLINNSFCISFAGRVTYKNAKRSIEVAKKIPNELFLVETDSPFIAPEPYKEEKNKTEYIKYIIEKLAEIKNMTYEGIEKTTSENTRKLFKKIK